MIVVSDPTFWECLSLVSFDPQGTRQSLSYESKCKALGRKFVAYVQGHLISMNFSLRDWGGN